MEKVGPPGDLTVTGAAEARKDRMLVQIVRRLLIAIPSLLGISVVLWFLSAYPKAPAGASEQQQLAHSFAGQAGRVLEPGHLSPGAAHHRQQDIRQGRMVLRIMRQVLPVPESEPRATGHQQRQVPG